MAYTLEKLFGVQGRSIVVVGGTSGIGLEIACALAELGSKVAVIGRTNEKCEKAGVILREKRPDSLAFQADVLNEYALRQVFARIAAAFGTIDGLVNSAGINHIEGLGTMAMADFNRVMQVNFTGTALSCKLAGEYMLKNSYGSVVNISSLSTLRGKSYYTAYAASKAAVDGFTRVLAVEWIRKGINVNSVAPGLVVTDINRADIGANQDTFRKRVESIPRGRCGETSSLVAPVVALLSPGSAHIVGQTIFCDGGSSIGDTFVLHQPRVTEGQATRSTRLSRFVTAVMREKRIGCKYRFKPKKADFLLDKPEDIYTIAPSGCVIEMTWRIMFSIKRY